MFDSHTHNTQTTYTVSAFLWYTYYITIHSLPLILNTLSLYHTHTHNTQTHTYTHNAPHTHSYTHSYTHNTDT